MLFQSRRLITYCICLISFFAGTANSLECYSCKDQDGNKDKCIKTSKQCEQSQNVCYSSITWRIPPYWTPRGNRIHYLSKDCDTQDRCSAKQKELKHLCIRDWYLDWQCHECCNGDLCNYYVTLGSTRQTIPILLVIASGLVSYTIYHFNIFPL